METEREKTGLTRRQAEGLLAAVIIARSTSYLLAKLGLREMGTFTLLSLRFLLAFALLALLFGRRLREVRRSTVLRGMLLGGVFFLVMTAELTGLRKTDSATTSFLENTAVVFVPLMEAVLRRRWPRPGVLLGGGVTVLGIGLLTLRHGLALGGGEGWCLLAAVTYAAAILLTDRLSRKEDPLLLGVLQVGFLGLFGLAAACLAETPRLPGNGTEWAVVLALAVVCSGFGFTLQPVAQRYTTVERAGAFCALNPLTAAVLGRVFLGETFGVQGILGAGCVVLGILLSAAGPRRAAADDVRSE